MERVFHGIVDGTKSFLIGITAGAIIGIVSSLLGLAVHKGFIKDALAVGRNTVIFTGSVGLLISAGMFLKKDGLRSLKDQEGWKKHFKVLNFGYILLMLFIGIILAGGVLDLLLYKF